MKTIFHSYAPGEDIPVLSVLKRRKLFKYYNREAMAAVLTAHEFLSQHPVSSQTPFYYSSAEVENYEFLRETFLKYTADGKRELDFKRYASMIPPPSQFKMMRNMVPCFISIENELKGDNNIIVDSASALLYSALTAPTEGEVLIGAGYLHSDGRAEAGFALIKKDEIPLNPLLGTDVPAIVFFRQCQ